MLDSNAADVAMARRTLTEQQINRATARGRLGTRAMTDPRSACVIRCRRPAARLEG